MRVIADEEAGISLMSLVINGSLINKISLEVGEERRGLSERVELMD